MSEIDNSLLVDLSLGGNDSTQLTSIEIAIENAEKELDEIKETIAGLEKLKPDCDKLDYILAVCSGALCGIVDVFLVGRPGESPIGNVTDEWFRDRTKDFAKLLKWEDNGDIASAIQFLEKKFKIPYDQSVGGPIFKELRNLTPDNHHFKSLGHNPTLLGLFFSVLDQFTNASSFVSNGELITLKNSEGKFSLQGHNVPSKLFAGVANWFGHLISDVSGASTSKGRGMGIPSPIWAWTNDIIAIKGGLNIPVLEYEKSFNELALKLFTDGYDTRFQAAQTIPVFVNECVVRLFYSVRRMMKYYSTVSVEKRSFALLWKSCEPFSNASVKRMLTVAHGTFCAIDIGDAVAQGFAKGGGYFNVYEFFMRLNIPGIGRFAVSVYGEFNRAYTYERESKYLSGKKTVVEAYLSGLEDLSVIYDDKQYLELISGVRSSKAYEDAFLASAKLAEKRQVPQEKILKDKADIDSYFTNNQGGHSNG